MCSKFNYCNLLTCLVFLSVDTRALKQLYKFTIASLFLPPAKHFPGFHHRTSASKRQFSYINAPFLLGISKAEILYSIVEYVNMTKSNIIEMEKIIFRMEAVTLLLNDNTLLLYAERRMDIL